MIVLPTGQLAQKITVISKTGLDFNADLLSLLLYRNSDGGFGGSKAYPSNNLDTALTLRSLAAAGSTDSTAINGSLSYLLSAQNSDGGWGFVKGAASHVYYAAIVMQALETQAQTTAMANVLSRATAYLLAQQQADGSWGNVPDTSLAFMAVVKTTGDMTSRLGALNYLLGQQLSNGSWNDDPYQTALALQALAWRD